jgi:hypothetical protein
MRMSMNVQILVGAAAGIALGMLLGAFPADAALRVRELARYLDVLSAPGGADSGADDGGGSGGDGGGSGGGGSSGDGSGGGWIAALDRRIAEQPPPPRRPPALLSDASPAPPAPPPPTAPTAPTAPPELPGEGISDATGGAPPPAKQPRLSNTDDS